MTDFLKIATWNVNSVKMRVQHVTDWLQRNKIDILLLQELKCVDEQFPLSEFEDIGYNCYVHGQKSYNGVAILSKYKADNVQTGFEGNPIPEEARYIEISAQTNAGYFRIASVYVPNGTELTSPNFTKKLTFLDSLNSYIKTREMDEKYIIGGDFNIALEPEDVYSPEALEGSLLFTTEERAKIRTIKNTGLIDPFDLLDDKSIEGGRYTWWDYRAGAFQKDHGVRIDYFLTSSNCAGSFAKLSVDRDERSKEKPSDHAPVILTLT